MHSLWHVFDRHLPAVIWAQRNDKLYLTINVEDCQDAVVNFGDSKLMFRYLATFLVTISYLFIFCSVCHSFSLLCCMWNFVILCNWQSALYCSGLTGGCHLANMAKGLPNWIKLSSKFEMSVWHGMIFFLTYSWTVFLLIFSIQQRVKLVVLRAYIDVSKADTSTVTLTISIGCRWRTRTMCCITAVKFKNGHVTNDILYSC